MKRLILFLTLCALLLTAVACDGGAATSSGSGSGSASESSGVVSGAGSDSSSAEDGETPADALPETDARGYVLVDNVCQNRKVILDYDDVSDVFAAGAPGYVVEKGPYMVDAATLDRLATANVEGAGSVIWVNFKIRNSLNNPDPFDGIIPVAKLKDPLFMSMNQPSELQTYMTARTVPENMAVCTPDMVNLNSIGAVYKNNAVTLADDDTVTVCLGPIRLAINTTTDGWRLADDMKWPGDPRVYRLPWESGVSNIALNNKAGAVTPAVDHIEIHLTGADFNGTAWENADGGVLHFWGTPRAIKQETFVGCAVSYVAWIKEPAQVGNFAATIGADQKNRNYNVKQAFSGRNWLLTTEPRTIIGHNVGPKAYDTVMDVAKVKDLLGI